MANAIEVKVSVVPGKGIEVGCNVNDPDLMVDILLEGMRAIRMKQKADREAAAGKAPAVVDTTPPLILPNGVLRAMPKRESPN